MSAATGIPADLTEIVRRHATFRLGLELRALRKAGITTVVFQPDNTAKELMGGMWMSGERVHDITQAAFDGAVHQFGRPDVRIAFTQAGHPPAGQTTRGISSESA